MRASEILTEHYVNVFTLQDMGEHAVEVFGLIKTAYSGIGGHSNFRSPDDLLESDYWKLVRRNGRIIAACIYKNHLGRKRVAIGHDGSPIAKDELRKIFREDVRFQRAWAEVSGASAKFAIRQGYPPVPNDQAEGILGKTILSKNGRFKYERMIAGHAHQKVIVGFPDGKSYEVGEYDFDEVFF